MILDRVLRVVFLQNSLSLSFTDSSHQYSATEADLQSCHRFESDTSTESAPKGCGEDLAMIRVLAQGERHRPAGTICGYSGYPESEHRAFRVSGGL